MLDFLLPVITLVLLSVAIARYRSDPLARVVGVGAAIALIFAVALVLPGLDLDVPMWQRVVLGAVAIVLAVSGVVYAERRRKRIRL